ncbi:hypothetical protein DL93DRAFT_2095716 [Clavulina sp. PMI_390]|nr:hypothetical protein DL93DRAFT_2095716 [Clavulina sp. PMI_390]
MSSPAPPPYTLDDRPLPEGWIREYDAKFNHFYYVNTRTQPPFVTWEHPLDHFRDDEKSNSSEKPYHQRAHSPSPSPPSPTMVAAYPSSSSTPTTYPTSNPAASNVVVASSSGGRNQGQGSGGIMGQIKNFMSDGLGDGDSSSSTPASYPVNAYAPAPNGYAPNVYIITDNGGGYGSGRGGGGRGGRGGRGRGGPLTMVAKAISTLRENVVKFRV